jgi:hypothetical protein
MKKIPAGEMISGRSFPFIHIFPRKKMIDPEKQIAAPKRIDSEKQIAAQKRNRYTGIDKHEKKQRKK